MTQIANKPEPPTDEDRDFWDVMDEEYESNIVFFEPPKASPDQGRPAAPNDDFWIRQYLEAPLSDESPYFDPVPSDQLVSRFAAALAKSKVKMSDVPELSRAFTVLDKRRQQQALRYTEDHVNGRIGGAQQERMVQVDVIHAVLDAAAAAAPDRSELMQTFMRLPEDIRRTFVREVRDQPPADALAFAHSAVQALRIMARATGNGARTLPAHMPLKPAVQPKGPDLRTLMTQAVEREKKRALFTKR